MVRELKLKRNQEPARVLSVGEILPLDRDRYRIGGKTGQYVVDWPHRTCTCTAGEMGRLSCWHRRAVGAYLREREAPCPACKGEGWLSFPTPFWIAVGQILGPQRCVGCHGTGRRRDVPPEVLARFEREGAR